MRGKVLFASLPIENLLEVLTNGKKVQHHRRCWAVLWSWAHNPRKEHGWAINSRYWKYKKQKHTTFSVLVNLLPHPCPSFSNGKSSFSGLPLWCLHYEAPESLEAKESGWKNGCHSLCVLILLASRFTFMILDRRTGQSWNRVETRV